MTSSVYAHMTAPTARARRDSDGRLKAPPSSVHPDWYRIENKKDDVARIDIYESIGYDPWFDEGVGAKQFAKDLREIKASRIELHINSPGGFAFDGVTMYNALRDHDAFVAVTVDGMAASAASIIAMAGDEVTMNRASEMMVHDASGLCYGQARDMEEMREFLDGISDDIAAIYADRAGGTKAEWRDIMHGEAWFSAQEAVDAGLADRVVELQEEDAEKAKNRFDLRVFAYAGRSRAPKPKILDAKIRSGRVNVPANEEVAKPEDEMTPEQLEVIGLPEDASDEDINARLAELATAEAELDTNDGGDEEPGEDESSEDESDGEESDEDESDETESDEDETPEAPDGTVVVDKAAFADMQAKLGQIDTLLAKEAKRERDALITNALNKGKFGASQRKDYEELYDSNPAAARKLINKLAENVVPVEELGHGGDVENQADDSYDRSALTPAERKRIDNIYAGQEA
jgi:ATP-dependent protease ClpP protease subunit